MLNNRIVYAKDGNEIWFYFFGSLVCLTVSCRLVRRNAPLVFVHQTSTMNIDGMPTCQVFRLYKLVNGLFPVSTEHYLSVYNNQRDVLSNVYYDLCYCL